MARIVNKLFLPALIIACTLNLSAQAGPPVSSPPANRVATGTQGNPVVYLSPGRVGSSPLFLDISQYAGATADVKLNTANAFALTTPTTTIDARALSGTQTIASQVNIGEFLPPTVSAVSTTSPGAGTYRLVYTLNAPALPCAVSGCTESEASEESIVTVTGAQGIQVNAPPFPGAATSYNVYMTAAAGPIWTELKCAAATNVAIGSNVTITATCGGAPVSKNNTGVSLFLPMNGHWQCAITDGTHMCLKWFDHAAIIGQNAGYGHGFKIESCVNGTNGCAATTNVSFVCGGDLDEKVAGMYVLLKGFECNNNINGTATMAGATDLRFGNAVAPAVFMQPYTIDTSQINEVHGFNGNGANGAGVAGCAIAGAGAGTSFINIGCDGGGSSATNGGPSLVVGGPTTSFSWGPLNFYGSSLVHPGNGFNVINWIGGGNAISFHGTYPELVGAACNAAVPMIDIGTGVTGGNVGGPIKISDLYAGASCAAPVIQVENGGGKGVVSGSYVFENIRTGSASAIAVNDLVLGASSPVGATVSRWSSGITLFGTGLATPYLQDFNFNKVLNLTSTTSAVDYLNVTNAATGNPASLTFSALGTDANVSINLLPKGTGTVGSTGGLVTGASPPGCSAGTAGIYCATEGTDGTNVAGASLINPNSTTHEFSAFTNGSTTAGMLVRRQPSAINQTAQTSAITTATLCPAAAGACNVAGQYHVHFNVWGSGTACATPGAGGVTPSVTWTDENAVTHAAVVIPMMSQTTATAVSVISTAPTVPFETALANEGGSGDYTISTNGSVIQYGVAYVVCGAGTGTYNVRGSVTRLQ
jgi:hypothetical protein